MISGLSDILHNFVFYEASFQSLPYFWQKSIKERKFLSISVSSGGGTETIWWKMESKQFKAKNWEIAEEKLENDLSVLNRKEQYSERWSHLIHHLIHHLREGGRIIFQFQKENKEKNLIYTGWKGKNWENFVHTGCPLTMMTIWVLLRLFKGEVSFLIFTI